MSKPLLVIVTGLPGTGKTSLGERIAQELRLPFLHKDGIKELLFDTLGWSDIEWSKKLGRASTELLYYFAEVQLMTGNSCAIESNFDATLATPKFSALSRKYSFSIVQIICKADPEVIRQRYQARWKSGQRHPGHVQHLDPRDDSWSHLPQGKETAMNIEGQVIEVDTTDFSTVDYTSLIAELRRANS